MARLRRWSDLTEKEQWQQAKDERAIRRRFDLEWGRAEEDLEDGVLFPMRRVKEKIRRAINVLRRKHGIELLPAIGTRAIVIDEVTSQITARLRTVTSQK